MFSLNDNFDNLKNKVFDGTVVENVDPLRQGRIKVSSAYVFGEIETQDLPWARPKHKYTGNHFKVPQKNKIVKLTFDNGDPHSPVYEDVFHYNINLQNYLKNTDEGQYENMSILHMDEHLQAFRDPNVGFVIDHQHSNIKIDNSGNISLNARDNKQFIRIGSEDASQSALLGDRWLDMFDEIMSALEQGPFLGNLGGPVIVSPRFAQVAARYRGLRPTLKSNHVFIVDNDMVKGLSRPAISQEGDKIKSTINNINVISRDVSHSPVLRDETKNNNCNCPDLNPREANEIAQNEDIRDETFLNDNIDYEQANNESSLTTGDARPSDIVGETSSSFAPKGQPFVDAACNNPKKLKVSKFLKINLQGGKPRLQPEAADSFDAMMEAYEKADFPYKQRIIFTSGLRCGRGTHSRGLAVDMFWGVRTAIFYSGKYDNFLPIAFRHPVYMWFIHNSWKFGWEQPTWANNGTFNPPNNRRTGDVEEWWHWEFMGFKKGYKINDPANGQRTYRQLADKYKVPFDPVNDVAKLRSTGQLTYFSTKPPTRVFG